MKRLDIKVGFSCNNLCRHCVQGEKRKLYQDKPTEQIKTELLQARRNCQDVVFTGGEPTIRKDLFVLVEYAQSLGYKNIQIQTNGRIFAYKRFVQEIIKAGANEFAIALHGHVPVLHDFLVGVNGGFHQTIKGMVNLRELNQRIITNTVITKPNYRNLLEIAKLLIDLGVRQYQFAFVHALGCAKTNFDSIVPRKTMVMPYVKQGLDLGIKAGIRVMTEAIPYCFMQGYEEYVAERVIPQTTIYDHNRITENFTQVRQQEGKLKADKCKKCFYYSICEGPWREYPEVFGWDEFCPVEKKD